MYVCVLTRVVGQNFSQWKNEILKINNNFKFFICVGVYLYVWIHSSLYDHMEIRGWHWISSSSPYFSEAGSLPGPGAHYVGQLADQQVCRILLFWFHVCMPPCLAVPWMLGIQAQILLFTQKILYPLRQLTSPIKQPLKKIKMHAENLYIKKMSDSEIR